MSKAGALFKLTRFPLVFTAAADSAVGAALVGVDLFHSTAWIPAVISSSLLYAGGMVLNDVVDLGRDRALHPERPLPSGRVTVEAAVRFALILFGAALVSAFVAGAPTLVWAAAMAALIAGYDGVFKHHAVAGSLAMAIVRGANLGLGAVAAGADPRTAAFPWIAISILGAYVFILTLWSTREDTRDGHRGFLALLGGGLIVIPLAGTVRPDAARWAAVAASAWILPWVVRALLRPEPARLMQTVRWGVLGILPLDASFLATQGRWAEAAIVAGLIVPALALLPLFRRL
jgi:4-hydroxybenzoate polyprenyltransferase